jgi:signal transduction histidine kinase
MPLFVHPNISAYRIKAGCNWISAKYLCFELGRRANNVTSGVIPRISREVLLKTKIGFPSYNVEDQELIVKEALQQSRLAKAKELGLQEVIDMMKAEYINEVRTRKHDMRPYLRELGSVERMMRKYVSDNDSEPEYQQKMFNLLDKYHEALNHLSDLIDIFSEEEQFGKPVAFNLDHYFCELKDKHDSESSGFEITYERDENALNEAGVINNQIAEKEISILNGLVSFKYEAYKNIDVAPIYTDIAPVDFDRLVCNIIENARKHGFTNPSETFYELKISLSVDAKREMFQIDFINNGTPLPMGVDKKRFGIRGEKAGITGGTGKGGYIVKSIAEHYKGDYDIFMDEENTVVRIFLPIAKQNDEQEV